MTLQDILEAIQTLPETDLQMIRQHIPTDSSSQPIRGTMDVDRLMQVLAEIRAELTDDQLEGIIADMTETYFNDEEPHHGE
ncbi:MAG: hypothetical protein KJ043_10690 [Anaerolineae bacterium]|nr:hypothetical protein [Anaerolineae bacterium]